MKRLIASLVALGWLVGAIYAQTLPFPARRPTPPIGTPSLYGSANPVNVPTTTGSFTTSANLVAGSLAVCMFNMNSNNAAAVSSISDGTNSYVNAAVGSFLGTRSEIWYKANAAAVSSGATVSFTLASSTGNGNAYVFCYQVTGIVPTSPLDANTGSGNNTAQPPSISTGTLAQPKELVMGTAMGAVATNYTVSSGFTNLQIAGIAGSEANGVDYQIVNSTASITYNPTLTVGSPSARSGTAMASFKGF